MIRIALDERPLAWHTVQVRLDGEPADMRVRYHLLAPEDAAARSAERLKVARAIGTGDASSAYDLLLERLSAAQIEAMRALLAARVVEWDLCDPQGTPIPVNGETLRAVLAHGAFLRPLDEGLIDASLGAFSKNG